MEKKRIYWIDGLKFLACLCVFFSHFQGFFLGLCDKDLGYSVQFRSIMESPFNILKNGNLWVCMFCIISGYFASKKKIDSLKKLLLTIWNRYLRFLIPFFVVNLLAYILCHTVGFQTQKYGQILGNSWFGEFYNFNVTLWVVIRASIKLTSELNSPLWMILQLFIGTCAIYFCKYLLSKISAKYVNVIVIIGYLVIVIGFPGIHASYLYSILTCMGALLNVIWEKKIWRVKSTLLNSVCLGTVFLMVSWGQNALVQTFSIQLPEHATNYMNAIYALLFLIIMEKVQECKNVLSSSIFRKFATLSFGIYVLHWLVLSTFSLWFYGVLQGKIAIEGIFISNLIITTIVVLIGAKVFYEIVEKRLMKVPGSIYQMVKKIDDVIDKKLLE